LTFCEMGLGRPSVIPHSRYGERRGRPHKPNLLSLVLFLPEILSPVPFTSPTLPFSILPSSRGQLLSLLASLRPLPRPQVPTGGGPVVCAQQLLKQLPRLGLGGARSPLHDVALVGGVAAAEEEARRGRVDSEGKSQSEIRGLSVCAGAQERLRKVPSRSHLHPRAFHTQLESESPHTYSHKVC